MSEQGPYEQLGVNEEASFDEIQSARNRLIAQCGDDRQQVATIEAAYDAVLMHRLRLRQEGKIKVPDRIRFAERAGDEQPKPKSAPVFQPLAWPSWMAPWLDSPTTTDVLASGAVFSLMGAIVLFMPLSSLLQLVLLGAIGASVYFLQRKEQRLGRAVLLSFLGLLLGFFLGYLLYLPLAGWLATVGINTVQFSAFFTLVVLWFITSFLR